MSVRGRPELEDPNAVTLENEGSDLADRGNHWYYDRQIYTQGRDQTEGAPVLTRAMDRPRAFRETFGFD